MFDPTTSSVLYYPFSRLIDISSLKQMMLLFETIAFCDPIDDDSWRAHLFERMEEEDTRYAKYREFCEAIPALRHDGVLRRIDPADVPAIQNDLTTSAILADIVDKDWSTLASMPEKYGLPVQRDRSTSLAAWNVFQQKIPDKLIIQMMNDPDLNKHVIREGGRMTSWQFSYVAGSAIGINTHLVVAEKYGLSPVTDSSLHHQLMMMKMARWPGSKKPRFAPTEELADFLARQTMMRIIRAWIPKEALEHLSVDQIVTFREQTSSMRRQFFSEIRNAVETKMAGASAREIEKIVPVLSDAVVTKAQAYRAEMEAVRDRLWADLFRKITSGKTISRIAASLGVSIILAPLEMLRASVPALTKWAVDRRSSKRKASTTVTYLTAIPKEAG